MKTTLNEILKHYPCGIHSSGKNGFSLLLKNLGKTESDDEPVDLMDILKSNGIEDAVWALQCFDYLDYCLFNADMLESTLDIFDEELKAVAEKTIATIKSYKSGKITKDVFIKEWQAADAYADAYTIADIFIKPKSTISIYAYAIAIADAIADAYSYAYTTTTAYTAYAIATAANDYDYDYAYAYADQLKVIEKIFIKHFGRKNEA